MGKLDGKVAAITASTRSIGRAIAEAYLAEGAKVVISGRSEEKGAAAIEEMNAGENATFIACDASKQSDVESLIDETVNHFGKIDIAVLNAGGILDAAPVAEMSDESWEYTLNLNLNHTFWGMRKALQHMIPQEDGRIIYISSIIAKTGFNGMSVYAATKAALEGFSRSLSRELGKKNITVNCISPGYMKTEMTQNINQKHFDKIQKRAPLGLPEVSDIANMTNYLLSRNGKKITGAVFTIDGGSTA